MPKFKFNIKEVVTQVRRTGTENGWKRVRISINDHVVLVKWKSWSLYKTGARYSSLSGRPEQTYWSLFVNFPTDLSLPSQSVFSTNDSPDVRYQLRLLFSSIPRNQILNRENYEQQVHSPLPRPKLQSRTIVDPHATIFEFYFCFGSRVKNNKMWIIGLVWGLETGALTIRKAIGHKTCVWRW
jgi:hypothetical protein